MSILPPRLLLVNTLPPFPEVPPNTALSTLGIPMDETLTPAEAVTMQVRPMCPSGILPIPRGLEMRSSFEGSRPKKIICPLWK